MKKSLITVVATMLLMCGNTNIYAEEGSGPLALENFSSTLYLTTDYIFRGVSFSGEEPALQGSFDYGYNNFYAGVWGSSIKGERGLEGVGGGDGFELELDFYGGYANSLGPIDYDLMLIYFNFPGAGDDFGKLEFPGRSTGDLETDQFEVWLTLGHGFTSLPLEPYVSVLYAFSPNFTLEDGIGNYVFGSVALTLPGGFGFDGGVGYQDVEGEDATGSSGAFCDPATGVTSIAGGSLCDGYSYTHWNVGLTKSVLGFNLDLRYHDTSGDSEHELFLGTSDLTDERVVFTVSRSF